MVPTTDRPQDCSELHKFKRQSPDRDALKLKNPTKGLALVLMLLVLILLVFVLLGLVLLVLMG